MNTIMHAAATTSNVQHSEFTPDWVFAGTHRTLPLSAHTDDLEPELPSVAAVQTIQWDTDTEPLVRVYANDGLALTLTSTEARTLAAMLSLSAGEADGHGPDVAALSARPALRAA